MNFARFKKYKLNRGMTYVELIVVLSIFSIMSGVVLFNYGDFQAKVDIKNLANDIAIRVVQAQKSAIYGNMPSLAQQASITSTWNPAYGIYIDKAGDDKSFIYFSDLNNNKIFEGSNCTSECVEKFSITKGNTISSLKIYYIGDSSPYDFSNLTISFTRPSNEAAVRSTQAINGNIDYVQINILSPKGVSSNIKIYPSGRIQIN